MKNLFVLIISLWSLVIYGQQSTWQPLGSPTGFSPVYVGELASAVTSDGVVYTAYSGGPTVGGKLIVQALLNGVSSYIGDPNGISVGSVSSINLIADGDTLYVAYQDEALGRFVVKKNYKSNTWAQIGEHASSDVVLFGVLAKHKGILYAAFAEANNADKIAVVKCVNNTWVLVGNRGFSGCEVEHISVAFIDDTIYVSYKQKDGGAMVVQKWDGAVWSIVGSVGFNGKQVIETCLAVNDNTLYIGFREWTGSYYEASVMKLLNNSWVSVGNRAFSIGATAYIKLRFNNNVPYVVYQDAANSDGATVMNLTGSVWTPVGLPNFSNGQADDPDLVFVNNEPVSIYHANNLSGRLVAQRYGMKEAFNSIEGASKENIKVKNYPNPFNPKTSIKFSLANLRMVNLAIYNAKGELIQKLCDGMKNAGEYDFEFNGSDLNSGVYFYKLTVDGQSVMGKMILSK